MNGRSITARIYRTALLSPAKIIVRNTKRLAETISTSELRFHDQNLYLENCDATPLEFLATIEEVFHQRTIIGAELRYVARREWSLLSRRRIYLVIAFRGAACFVGAARFGTALMVNSRYTASSSRTLLILYHTPVLGGLVRRVIEPTTFYRTDILHAFEQCVRSVVLEATALVNDEGPQVFREPEQPPLLEDLH